MSRGLDLEVPDSVSDTSQNRFLGDRPDMLPFDTDLVGREDELETLRGFLARGAPVPDRHRGPARVSIFGEAGVGKSALGTSFAYSIEDRYADGALYVDLNNTPTANKSPDTSQILRSFLVELLDSPAQLPQDAQDLHAAFVKATDRRSIIVFLDNVKDYDSVKDLVPKSSTCLVIFTSQERLQEGQPSLRLEPLSLDSAVELFGLIAPSRNLAGAEADDQLKRVLQACEGLPIAIRVLAARLEGSRSYTLDRILEDLDRYQDKPHFTALFGGDRRKIEACFRVGYNGLNPVQSMLFRRLGVAPGESFDISLAAHLGDLRERGADLVLDELRALQLIRETQDPDYFTMHSLWREFARDQLDETEAGEQPARALAFYCRQAEDKDRVIRSVKQFNDDRWSRDNDEPALAEWDQSLERDWALDWMEKQHKNLVAAVKRACDEHQADIAWRTCRALVEFFEIRGKWESWGQTHAAAERVVPEQSIGRAHVWYGLGRLNSAQRRWPEAISNYRSAITAFRKHGEQVQVGRCLNSLGDVYRYMRNWDAAENCFRRSLEILQESHSPRQIAIAKRSMSTIYRQRGQFATAERLCLEAIEILVAEDIRDERWIAATNLSLADIYLDSGSQDARALLEECLEIFEKLKDAHWLILTRRSLGEALREEDDYEGAMEQLEACGQWLRQAQDDHWEGQILHSKGLVHLSRMDLAQASSMFASALDKFRLSRDILWEGRTHVSIGRTLAAEGQVAAAQAAYHAAWPLLVEQGANADVERLEALLDVGLYGPEAARPGPDQR
jgi:tetratricopeptide (TPR) repeat protein